MIIKNKNDFSLKNNLFIKQKIKETERINLILLSILLSNVIKKNYEIKTLNIIKTYVENKNKFDFILKLKELQFLTNLLNKNVFNISKKLIDLGYSAYPTKVPQKHLKKKMKKSKIVISNDFFKYRSVLYFFKKNSIKKKYLILKIKFTINNIHITLLNKKNKVIRIITCGSTFKRGRVKKRSAFIVRETFHKLFRLIRELKYKSVHLYLKGIHSFKHRYLSRISKKYRVSFRQYVIDNDAIPHNGCRLRKQKRK